MTTRIVRVGNTLAVELPEELATKAALSVGDPVEWLANDADGLSLVKQTAPGQSRNRKRMSLDKILDGIPEGASMGEIDWGSPRGAEAF